MSIKLNAFPLRVPVANVRVTAVAYEETRLKELRASHRNSHLFRRRENKIQIFSANGDSPLEGDVEEIALQDNNAILCYLVRESLIRHVAGLGRRIVHFNPLEFVSERQEDSLAAKLLGPDYPFEVVVKYVLDTRIICGKPHLLIDSATKTIVAKNCASFIEQGFELPGRYVAADTENGYRKVIGEVLCVKDNKIEVLASDDQTMEYSPEELYLEGSRTNFDDFLSFTHGQRRDSIIEKLRTTVSSVNSGLNKYERIEKVRAYFSTGITLLDGTSITLDDAVNIAPHCGNLSKPTFVFNDSGEASWTELGLSQFGPYTKRTFDRNDPSICVVCSMTDKGRVEQFVRKFLKGIPASKYFKTGLEGKFHLGTSRVEIFPTASGSVQDYRNAIESALKKKAEDGSKWDLALVEVRRSFKKLSAEENPYYLSKTLFFLHQVPVQEFTYELLEESDYTLGYSLNNMALASYAKMSGVPWLLKSSPTLSHELVFGIGSANVGQGGFRLGDGSWGLPQYFPETAITSSPTRRKL